MKYSTPLLTAAFLTAPVGMAQALTVVDFNDLAPGTVVTDQYAGLGLTVAVDNPNNNGNNDQAEIWDFDGNPQIPGIQVPFTVGNLAPADDLGNGLVIDGGPFGNNGFFNLEIGRPAGQFIFTFDRPVETFGFDAFDIEGPEEFETDSGYFVDFLNDGADVATIFFGNLITPGNVFFDPTIEFGDDSANNLGDYTPVEIGGVFNEVRISFGGSGALDNLRFEFANPGPNPIPTPSAALAGLALLGLASLRRRPA